MRRALTFGALLASTICIFTICIGSQLAAALTSPQGQSTATIIPSLLPDRLGAEGALQLTVNFGNGLSSGVPLPVRRAILRFPSGLGIEIPHLRSCSIARLRARGPSGCSAQSELGRGHALAEAMAGSQLITENISLWLFLGPFHNLEPSFEIFGQGITPLMSVSC